MAPPRQGDVCRKCGQPRKPNADMVLCEAHYREYMREHANTRNHALGAEYQRLAGYLRDAKTLGANEAESWWCAMAAEAEYQAGRARPYWLRPFLQAELDWLRANSKTLAKLNGDQEVA
jgi:hypothetical protein